VIDLAEVGLEPEENLRGDLGGRAAAESEVVASLGAGHHRGVGAARVGRDHANAGVGQLAAQRFVESGQAGFGGGVGGVEGHSDSGGAGGDADHGRTVDTAGRAQRGQRGAGQQDRRGQVDRDHREDVLDAGVFEVAGAHRPGVVDQDVDAVEGVGGAVDHERRLTGLGEVSGQHDGTAAAINHRTGGRLERVAAAPDQRQGRTALGEAESELSADAAPGPGQQHPASFEPHAWSLR